MNDEERKVFWNTLCSLKGNDKFPKNIIKYPKRSLTIKNLEEIKNNKLSFPTSNYYDDPFDPFLRIDRNELIKSIDEIFHQDNIIEKIKYVYKEIGISFNEKAINKILESFDIINFCNKIVKLIKSDIRNTLRSYTLSVCFSESESNEALWIKYANQHKEYDMENETNYCVKKDECSKCDLKNTNPLLYTIYYSDEPNSATEYTKWFTASLVLRQLTSNKIADDMIFNLFPKMEWEKEKITLIKKKCHMYDQEWRLECH